VNLWFMISNMEATIYIIHIIQSSICPNVVKTCDRNRWAYRNIYLTYFYFFSQTALWEMTSLKYYLCKMSCNLYKRQHRTFGTLFFYTKVYVLKIYTYKPPIWLLWFTLITKFKHTYFIVSSNIISKINNILCLNYSTIT